MDFSFEMIIFEGFVTTLKNCNDFSLWMQFNLADGNSLTIHPPSKKTNKQTKKERKKKKLNVPHQVLIKIILQR